MSGQTRTSTDLRLTSGGLVGAGVKVDSARWDSREFLEPERNDVESRLKMLAKLIYLSHI